MGIKSSELGIKPERPEKQRFKSSELGLTQRLTGAVGETMALQKIMRDMTAQFGAEYVNQFLLGLPKPLLQKIGIQMPKPITPFGEAAKVGGTVTGTLAGLPQLAGKGAIKGISMVAPRIMGKRLLPTVARTGIEGAVIGGVTTPETKTGEILLPRERLKQAAITGGLGVGISGTLGIAGKIPRYFEKAMGISDATIQHIKNVGRKVFNPKYRPVNYIGAEIVPKLENKIAQNIVSNAPESVEYTNETLSKLGFSYDDIQKLQSIDKETLRRYMPRIISKKFGNIESVIKTAQSEANNYFEKTIDEIPKDKTIDISKTFTNLRKMLFDGGIINEAGKIEKDISLLGTTSAENRLYRTYITLQGFVLQGISPKQYLRLKNQLNMIPETNKVTSGIVKNTIATFTADVVESLPELGKANKIYQDSRNMEVLKTVYGKLNEPQFIETTLSNLHKVGKESTLQDFRGILGKELSGDLLNHLVNKDYNRLIQQLPGQAPQKFITAPSLLRSTVLGISRGYRGTLPKGISPEVPRKIALTGGILGGRAMVSK